MPCMDPDGPSINAKADTDGQVWRTRSVRVAAMAPGAVARVAIVVAIAPESSFASSRPP